ncbi:MAG: FAD synthase [Thaumarchaeota archaeon]|nr:FAD synthase [Nitrososphaerota archaeon]
MEELDVLRAVYSASLREGRPTVKAVALIMEGPSEEVSKRLRSAATAGLVQLSGPGVVLTPKGRSRLKVVMIGGAFEIIHPGHLHTVEQARKLGNTLVVVVAADKTVTKNKGRDPVTSQEWRVKLVSAVRGVDVGLPGGQGSIYDTLEKVRPDVVALGYDQTHNPKDIELEARSRGLELRVVRLSSPLPDVKTSKIVNAL